MAGMGVDMTGPCERCGRSCRWPLDGRSWEDRYLCTRCHAQGRPRSAFDPTWWERFLAWLRPPPPVPGRHVAMCSRCRWQQTFVSARPEATARLLLDVHNLAECPNPQVGGLSARTTRGPDAFERAGVKPTHVQQATGYYAPSRPPVNPVPPHRRPPAPTPTPGPGRKVLK